MWMSEQQTVTCGWLTLFELTSICERRECRKAADRFIEYSRRRITKTMWVWCVCVCNCDAVHRARFCVITISFFSFDRIDFTINWIRSVVFSIQKRFIELDAQEDECFVFLLHRDNFYHLSAVVILCFKGMSLTRFMCATNENWKHPQICHFTRRTIYIQS